VSSSRRRAIFAVILGGCTLVVVVALLAGIQASRTALGSAADRGALRVAQEEGRPTVVFRDLGGGSRGQLALAPLTGGPGERKRLPLRCDRVHFAAGTGLCVARGSGFASGFQAKVFGTNFEVRHELDLAGIPSRARVSRDGRLGTVTMFVTGHSYAESGAFSTETTLIDMRSGRKIADLEDFSVTDDGRHVTAVDRNFWGVTFADDSDRFYATMATGGKTYLLEGSVSSRRARVLHENVECPSLSPDGTRVAYKHRTGSDSKPWRVSVLDLETMRETPLAESRSVDDQVEWLDGANVLYAIDGEVFTVPADGSGTARSFLPQADSPAVVRW
jgi:hypothetical protein